MDKLPFWLEVLKEGIGANLPFVQAIAWPKEFQEALGPTINLEIVFPRFILPILEDEQFGAVTFASSQKAVFYIREVASVYRSWIKFGRPSLETRTALDLAYGQIEQSRNAKEIWALRTAKSACDVWLAWGTLECENIVYAWAKRAAAEAWVVRPRQEDRVICMLWQRKLLLDILKTPYPNMENADESPAS